MEKNLVIKPCPFCGGEANLVRMIGKTNIYYIECSECRAMMGRTSWQMDGLRGKLHFESDEDVVQEWNTRTESTVQNVR